MDDLTALRFLVEWGADEALADVPVDRFVLPPAIAAAPDPGPAQLPPRPAAASLRPPIGGAVAASQASALAAAAATLDALHAALDGFEGCSLRATATNTVRPSGNPAAGLVLVAEAPGAEDDRTGAAFSGPPGQMLDRVLGSIGLDRSAVLLTHLVPWRPPGSRAPNDAEIQACLPFLHRLLALAQPRRILLVGAGPAKALAGTTEGVRRLRGRWLPVPIEGAESPAQALALPPQDHWMRSAAAKRSLWADLLELRQSIDQAS
jgi:uracil-DNA glycosylase family 4